MPCYEEVSIFKKKKIFILFDVFATILFFEIVKLHFDLLLPVYIFYVLLTLHIFICIYRSIYHINKFSCIVK